jgi:hypothetical protein
MSRNLTGDSNPAKYPLEDDVGSASHTSGPYRDQTGLVALLRDNSTPQCDIDILLEASASASLLAYSRSPGIV